jgi:hypothetical protein
MNIATLLIYIVASIILNIILNKIEKKKLDNIIDYIVISNIYILILSGLFDFYKLTSNNDNIFIIILFQVLGKILFLTLIKERTNLKNNNYNIKKYLITLVTGYLINTLIINKVDNIFPSSDTIKLLIWLFIIGYTLLYIKKNIDIKVPIDNNVSFYQDKEYIVMQYAKYKTKYNSIISSKYDYINQLTYSIMIYENYNKPELIRKIDLLKYKLFHEENKFGIMQIDKKQPITDEESIELSIKKIEKLYATNIKDKVGELEIVKFLIKKYYKKDIKEIISIYQTISKFNKN